MHNLDISNTWQIKKLGEICKKSFPSKSPPDSWPYIEISDVNVDNKSIVFKDKKSVNGAVVAPKNSIIVSRVRPTRGAITLLKQEQVVSSAFTILKARDSEALPKFLFYSIAWSRDFLTYLHRKQKGSNYPSVRERDILAYEIPLPPLPIQKSIVERLDAIKKAQELNDKQIILADELFQSLLHKELNPRGKNWEVRKIGEVCEKIQQSHPKKIFKETFTYIDIESIDSEINTIIEAKTIGVNKAPSRARKLVKEEDTIFATTRPYLKNIAYVSQKFDNCIVSTGFCVIRGKKDLAEPRFLFYTSLSKPFISKVLIYQRGASYPAVSDTNIYGIKIPLPPLPIQREIVEKLQTVQNYKKKLLEQKQKLKELFESCLDKAMKGELVNQKESSQLPLFQG